ncbi:MAG: tryptophan-rich sensory protein [Bacteroidales bacterium]|jgi:tryptophan-rich sensory protein|nr:tryptophan-rich sensory protein [Bacteroidales bacterium]NPV36687.1 tryptophan-rich sensory protein [Bacteroidales bacterium]
MNKLLIIKLLVSIALPLGIGAFAGIFTSQSIPEWYATLNKPSFNPPNWIFGPMWSLLYILMGISFFLIWKQPPSSQRNLAILCFALQLVLNFSWSFIFFYYKLIGLALLEIIFLLVSICLMILMFYKLKPLAAYLNIPYLLWVSFATVLNGAINFLNRN